MESSAEQCPQAFMERLYDELQSAEPPVYAMQSKPRGRKPKAKSKASTGTDGVEVETLEKATGKKGKKAKSGKKKGRKSNKKSDVAHEEADEELQEHAEDAQDSAGSMVAWHDPADPIEDDREVAADVFHEEAKQSEPASSSAAEPKAKASKEAKGKASKVKASKPKAKGKAKRASSVDAENGGPNENEIAAGEDQEPVVRELPPGYVQPPEWVTSNNVYTNAYRRGKASGESAEKVKELAREARLQFSMHGGVLDDLATSFGKCKRGKRAKVANEIPADNPPQGWYVNEDKFLMPDGASGSAEPPPDADRC